MVEYLCKTCGTQFPASAQPPEHCPICEDPRQYVPAEGQQWTTLEQLRAQHHNNIREEEPRVHSIHTEPEFPIGQRAFVVQTSEGNVLWDCLALIDDATIQAVRELGGIQAIAVSHPHYYTTMIEWSRTFGNAPIHIHELDRRWVMYPHSNVHYWTGDSLPLFGGLTLVKSAGHFEGFQVLHWPDGNGGAGALFAGDQPQVCADRNWVTFMYSYPNFIPLGKAAVEGVVESLRPWKFDRLYGAFPNRTVARNAKDVIERSAARFLEAIAR